MNNKEVIAVLKRAKILIEIISVKQVLESDNDIIFASGINPWCVNEGTATGYEKISTYFIDNMIKEIEND